MSDALWSNVSEGVSFAVAALVGWFVTIGLIRPVGWVVSAISEGRRRARLASLATILALGLVVVIGLSGCDTKIGTGSGAQNEMAQVSNVDETAQVPNVEGQTRNEAEQTLRSEGFQVAAELQASSEDDVGLVVEQDPSSGSLEEKGSTVTVKIGTSGIEVPDLAGTTPDAAEKRVGEDFRIDASEGDVSGEPIGTIIGQDPEPGQWVSQGSTVSVVTSAGQPPNPGDIFADDFSDKDFSNTFGGWDIGEYNCCVSEYLNGGYRMYSPPSANTDNTGLANEVGDIEDAILEVDATRIGDAPEEGDSYWGIGCRVQGDYSGYYMEIWDDGYAEIYKYEDDKHNDLVWGYFEDAIREGSATNHTVSG